MGIKLGTIELDNEQSTTGLLEWDDEQCRVTVTDTATGKTERLDTTPCSNVRDAYLTVCNMYNQDSMSAWKFEDLYEGQVY